MSIRDEIERLLPDVEEVTFEPHDVFCNLPAVGVFIAESLVISRKDGVPDGSERIVRDEDTGIQRIITNRCCNDEVVIRQYFLIEVVGEQCDGVVQKVGTIVDGIIQILDTFCAKGHNGCEPVHEDNSSVIRPSPDDETSSTLFSWQLRYYTEYLKSN